MHLLLLFIVWVLTPNMFLAMFVSPDGIGGAGRSQRERWRGSWVTLRMMLSQPTSSPIAGQASSMPRQELPFLILLWSLLRGMTTNGDTGTSSSLTVGLVSPFLMVKLIVTCFEYYSCLYATQQPLYLGKITLVSIWYQDGFDPSKDICIQLVVPTKN